MTFTEAALEVLRTAGEPLHYKKITELAIERNLLSHVGKTPEVTMSSRLAMMVKKDRGQAPIIKVKPGVFAIRESALQGQSLSPAALAAINEIEGLDESAAPAQNGAAAAPEAAAAEEQPAKAAPQLPGSDVFPEEEGDDDPILAGLEQESEGGERAGRRRRRRRRRGKGEKAEAAPEPSARPEPVREPSRERPRESFRERDRSRHERFERQDRNDRNDRPERQDRQERNDRPERGERNERHARGEERSVEARDDGGLDWNRQPGDGDLLGKDLADAVWSVLSRGDRTPHSFSRVAELLVRRGRLSGAPAALAPTIAAAVRADIARGELQRGRPRFRLRGGRLALSEWQLPKGLSRAEQDMLSSAERYASEVRRALIQKLSELPTAGFAELLATWLNAEGVTALRAVRRPGSSGSELHFAGTRKTGSEELRLAIVVQRNGRDIDREAVIDVRGALHHYGQAQAAWVVTLGRITSGAREEAAAQASACALFDGNALAAAMERLGIAMRRHVIAHHEIDYELLEALGDSPEQRERREREQERERQKHNERTQRTRGERSQGESLPPPATSPHAEDADDAEDDGEELVTPKALRDADWDEESDALHERAPKRTDEQPHDGDEDADDESAEGAELDSGTGEDDEQDEDSAEEDELVADERDLPSFRDELEEASDDDESQKDEDEDEPADEYDDAARDEDDDSDEDESDEDDESDDSDDAPGDDDEDEDSHNGSEDEDSGEEEAEAPETGGRRRDRG